MNKLIPRLLWIDSLGAIAAGLGVLALSSWLAGLHNLPLGIIIFIGVTNIIYGCFSFTLAKTPERSVAAIAILSVANMLWLMVCIGMVGLYFDAITAFGMLHILGEGLYVFTLGLMEFRNRNLLANPECKIL